PKSGSDGGGLEIARALGVATVPTYPALVPLTTADARWTALAGVAARARLRACRGDRVLEERERELLFTHRGFSGPVVLDMSRHVTALDAEDIRLRVRWGGGEMGVWEGRLRSTGKRRMTTALAAHLPARLADELVGVAAVPPDRREHELTRDERARLLAVLDSFELPVNGNEGYATAEVTAGGVALGSVDPHTLECRTAPGLYVCGEILDTVGRIGGYNFLWAWVSGRKGGE